MVNGFSGFRGGNGEGALSLFKELADEE